MNETYWFDIDNTICITEENDYPNAKPIQARIDKINALHNKGCYIIIATSRGAKSGKDWLKYTEGQLFKWEVRYDLLYLKPHADIYVDDKAVNANDFNWSK